MNKTLLFRMLLFAFLIIGVSGCKKEDIKTPGELIGEQLQEVINSEEFHRVSIYSQTSFAEHGEEWNISIEGQFLFFKAQYDNHGYNLNHFIEYNVAVYDHETDRRLLLYFN